MAIHAVTATKAKATMTTNRQCFHLCQNKLQRRRIEFHIRNVEKPKGRPVLGLLIQYGSSKLVTNLEGNSITSETAMHIRNASRNT